jgi:hypothetical protein
MRLFVTLTGDVGKDLVRGAIWELDASSYLAYVHIVPSARLDSSRSVSSVVSVTGPTWEGVLDTAIARVMTAIGQPVQNLQVRAPPRNSKAPNGKETVPYSLGAAER